MQIEGRCHCGNIRYTLDWPDGDTCIQVRACGCTFCTKHGAAWTSHRDAKLTVDLRDVSLVSKYNFGTATADFYVCARCGAAPFATSLIDDGLYAVVNTNTFEGIAPSSLARRGTNFDGEDTGDRLERRKGSWIPTVRISVSDT